MNSLPRISFGIIVLNGEPFTKYSLRNLYPFAHEIIVVEGGSKNAAEFAPKGHSTDGTREALIEFKKKEDPENKVKIITKEGFWNEKNEQSQAYAKIATGDYLWQVDVDEFYKREDIEKVIRMLRDNPQITQVSFKMRMFWGGFNYCVDGWKFRSGGEIFQRLFKWGPEYHYTSHRPPTVFNSSGQNLRNLLYISGYKLEKEGVIMYHYSYIFPRIVFEKCQYHLLQANTKKYKDIENWPRDTFMNLQHPFNVDSFVKPRSWIDRYYGTHPEVIYQLQDDISMNKVKVEIRTCDDIEDLLSKPVYIVGKILLKTFGAVIIILKRFYRKTNRSTWN